MILADQIAMAQQRAAALQAQRRAVSAILSQPGRWPAPVWHWARAVLPATEPRGYKLLYRLTERRAA
jgi:hypothetical protein